MEPPFRDEVVVFAKDEAMAWVMVLHGLCQMWKHRFKAWRQLWQWFSKTKAHINFEKDNLKLNLLNLLFWKKTHVLMS